MKTVKVVLAILVMFLSFTHLFSQVANDTIYKKSGKILVAKVTEVLPDMVKYISPNGKDSIIMGIDKDDIQKIVFANGLTHQFVSDMVNPEHYASQHKSDLKIDFLAPALNHTTMIYERSVAPGESWETSATIVGLGIKSDNYRTDAGAIFGFGYKLMHAPDFYARGQHYAHILKGGYIRFQGYLGYYTETTANYYYYSPSSNGKYTDRYTVGGLHIQLGKQFVFEDSFVIDIFGGIGYSIVDYGTDQPQYSSYNSDYKGNAYNYVFARFSEDSFLGVSGGIRIGFLF